MLEKTAVGLFLTILSVGIVLAACGGAGTQDDFKLPSDPKNYAPVEKFEAMKVPTDNEMSAAKAALGWQLFFDQRLSGDGSRSCYSCHVNEKGLTDGLPVASAAYGKKGTRSSPTLWNVGYLQLYYWDGRAPTLEKQALAAWKLVNMGAKDPKEDKVRPDIIEKVNSLKGYKDQFQKVFGGPATEETIVKAIACYVRTIISKTTAFDRWDLGRGDPKAISDAAKRGWDLFQKAKCTNCHQGVFLSDMQFHNVGIGVKDGKPTDVGRVTHSKVEKDTGAFKTPTMRDVARSAPYFHDGSVATLEEAVKQMVNGGIDNPYLDRVNLQKQDLSNADIKDIVEFLKSLTETAVLKEPKLPQ